MQRLSGSWQYGDPSSLARTAAALASAAADNSNGTLLGRTGGDGDRSGAAGADRATTPLRQQQKPVAMTPQHQQQQHPTAQFALRHTLTFAPPQPPPTSSAPSYFSPLPHPHPHASVTESNMSAAATHFHTAVSFPNHANNSHAAFPHPFLPQNSHPASFPPLPPANHSNSHSPFLLHPPPPFPPPPPSAGPVATHSHPAPDPALFHAALARLSAIDPSPYPPPPTSSLPLSSPAYPMPPYPFPPAAHTALPSPHSLTAAASFPIRSVRANVWHCPLGCGQSYKKSSGRSIRRHFVSCFRQHNQSAAATMSDTQLSSLIAERQDTGQLATGLRRWRMRSARRRVDELRDEERWECVWGCGKRYRSTSTRSIQRHIAECDRRPGGGNGRDQSRRATASGDNGGRGRDSEEEEEEDDDEELEEEERDREQSLKPYQSSMSLSSAAPIRSASPSTPIAAPAFSSGASLPSPALTSIVASTASYSASYPSAAPGAGPSTLQLLSSAATNSRAPHHTLNNHTPLFASPQHTHSNSATSSAASSSASFPAAPPVGSTALQPSARDQPAHSTLSAPTAPTAAAAGGGS